MGQDRRLPAEILIEQKMFGGRRYPFLAAHDMGDAHQMIVDDIGQMIGWQAIRFHQHLHIDGLVIDLDNPAQRIFKTAGSAFGDDHPYDMGCTSCLALDGNRVIERAVCRIVFRRQFGRSLVRAHRGQFVRCTIAFEGMAIRQQPVAMFGVNACAFRLAIRAVRSADVRAFIPAEAHPF